jgi:uncharacterized SAM-binding protein YcdF (DUF218 family)
MIGQLMLYSLRILLITALAGSVWLTGLILFTRIIPSGPFDAIGSTDGIVIFTGGKTRLNVALDLFQQKKGRYLLVSGVNHQSNLSEIVDRLASKSQITLGYSALDTLGNAEETAAWARNHHLKTLRLITSNYHMPRSLFELRHLLPGLEIIPHPVVGKSFLHPKWWLDLPTLCLVIQEYNKFLFALIRRPIKDIQRVFIHGEPR